jgi:DmsE family decaheme c-type cytochrome
MRKILLAALSCALATPVAAGLPPGWVGKDTCATCHEDVVKIFVAGPHGRAMAERGRTIDHTVLKGELLDRSCESCHGPGQVHANDPSKANISGLHGSAREASRGCPACHPAQDAGLATRSHGHIRAAVACLDCHVTGHAAPLGEPLLARTRGEICNRCHASQAAQFQLPYAHREGRTPFECMNCHSVHGGTTVKGRIEEYGRSRCVTCHTEKAGPFVYPHPPREVSGCLACHQPHGSPNPMLLTRANGTQLCLECHSDTPSFHDLTKPQYRSCVACHAAVQGSQRDSKLFNE